MPGSQNREFNYATNNKELQQCTTIRMCVCYQLLIMRTYIARGHPGGGANLSPLSTSLWVCRILDMLLVDVELLRSG